MTQPTETRQVARKYAETVTEKPVWGHFFSAMSTPSSTDLTVGKFFFNLPGFYEKYQDSYT